MQKQKEKDEQERLDKKISIENSNYNPYGRGGGGAPIKDKDGNVVANLAQIKPDSNPYTPRDMGNINNSNNNKRYQKIIRQIIISHHLI